MESDSSSARVQKLSDNNYHSWKQKSIHFLALKDLDECIDQDPPVNAGEANRRSWKRKDRKAQEAIGLLISDELLQNVPDSISTKEMWCTIKDVFERHTLLNKLAARRKFYTAAKNESVPVLQFSNRISQLTATL